MSEDRFDEANVTDFIDEVKEIDMDFKDHRADDDFEKMLAELNGNKYEPVNKPSAASVTEDDSVAAALAARSAARRYEEKKAPKPKAEKSASKPTESEREAKADKTDRAEEKTDIKPEDEKNDESGKAAESREAVPAMAAVAVPAGGIEMPGALPVSGASQRKRRKNRPAEAKSKDKKEPELTEQEKLEAQRLEQERAEKEREQKLIESIASIWKSPDFSSGGRVTMNIKTDQRKEIRITIPSDHEERMQARKDAQLAELARADIQRRNVEEEQRIAAAAAAIEKLEEPEIPPELLGHKPKPQQSTNVRAGNKPVKAAAADGTAAPLKRRELYTAAVISSTAAPLSRSVEAEPTRVMSAVRLEESAELPRKRRGAAEAAPVPAADKSDKSEKPYEKPSASAEAAQPEEKAGSQRISKKKAERLAKIDLVNKKFAMVNVIVCCTIFFGLGVFLAVCKRESGFIQSENRTLAEKPKLSVQSLLDGSYFDDITKWYTDTIPGREELKPFSSGFEKLFGLSFGDVAIKGDIKTVKKETLDPDINATTTTVTLNTDFGKNDSGGSSAAAKKNNKTSEKLLDVPDTLDDGAWVGDVVVSGKGENVRAMGAFYGQFEMGRKYAETINRYKEDLGSSVNVYTLNMPSAAAYYLPKNLADEFTSQQDCITNIGNDLEGIINVDTYPVLESHKDEYIYARTDHHWTPLGAYYAARAFSVMGSFEFPELDTYEECRIDDFVGTMYAYSNYDEELAQNPDTFIYYKPDNGYTVTNYDRSFENGAASSLFFDYASGVNCYSAILGTDDQITEIETDANSGRTLVVIKDSFGNAMIPFLTHGFDKIYVVDFRYFEINAIDFINDVGATDLLFAMSLGAAHTESHINAIGNLRIQTNSPVKEQDLPEVKIPEVVIPDESAAEPETDGADEYISDN